MRRAWALYIASAVMFMATVGFGFDLFGIFSINETQWLVILEHNWEDNLSEREFSEGEMLKTFFKKDKNVQVRHRFFSNVAGLKKWCAEIHSIRGPVVLMICDHGSPEGLFSDDGEIGWRAIAESLEGAENLKLIHISACSVLRGNFACKLMKHLGMKSPPVSGYSTDINWTLSGIVDMLYLDLILTDHYPPWGFAQ